MTSIFKDMTTQGLEESQDRLGGFAPIDTGIYEVTIKNLFAGKSASGANCLTLIAQLPGSDKEYKETIYFTNKKGENFFINKNDDKKKSPLPGFTTVNDICLIATGKELTDQETEEKVVNIYDPDSKKELPKSVPVLTECIGQKIALGIVRALENKEVKNAAGEYEPTAEERENNFIDKVFHPEMKVTVVEARQGKKTGEFWDAWLKRNKGQVRDRRSFKGDKSGAPPKAGAKGAVPTAPKKSLFGK